MVLLLHCFRLAHLFLNCDRIKNGDKEAWRALLPGKCRLDDVVELRKKIAEAKPLEGGRNLMPLEGTTIDLPTLMLSST